MHNVTRDGVPVFVVQRLNQYFPAQWVYDGEEATMEDAIAAAKDNYDRIGRHYRVWDSIEGGVLFSTED